jgi:uncharacterized protein YndB with AHSA1/START domain
MSEANTAEVNNTFAKVIEPDTVRIERVLPGPIERVWAYLTESNKRGKWFASGAMELRVGGKVELNFNHAELSSEKTYPEKHKDKAQGMRTTGEITRCEPPRVLAYKWFGGPGDSSEVMFELTPRGKEVLLVLTHSRLANRATVLGVSGGWHAHLGILEDNLNGVEPRPFWTTHAKLEAEYKRRIPGV